MPQLNGEDGDDLGANDELIAFKDEGEHEEKRNVSAERDLDDVKSSLVNESETNSSSDSEVSPPGSVHNFSPSLRRRLRRVFTVHHPPTTTTTHPVFLYFQVQGDRRPKPPVDLQRRARHGQLLDEDGNQHFISTCCCPSTSLFPGCFYRFLFCNTPSDLARLFLAMAQGSGSSVCVILSFVSICFCNLLVPLCIAV